MTNEHSPAEHTGEHIAGPLLNIGLFHSYAVHWGYAPIVAINAISYLQTRHEREDRTYFDPTGACLYPNTIQRTIDQTFGFGNKNSPRWSVEDRGHLRPRLYLLMAVGYHFAEELNLPTIALDRDAFLQRFFVTDDTLVRYEQALGLRVVCWVD